MVRKRKVHLDGEILATYRENSLLTQEQLADKAGVSPGTVNRLENGKHEARFSTIAKFAKALGIEPEELIIPPASVAAVALGGHLAIPLSHLVWPL